MTINLHAKYDDTIGWWYMMFSMKIIRDHHIWWSYMMFIYETEEMGYTPKSDNLTGNYNVKLTFSPKPWNDPTACVIISIRPLSQEWKRNGLPNWGASNNLSPDLCGQRGFQRRASSLMDGGNKGNKSNRGGNRGLIYFPSKAAGV